MYGTPTQPAANFLRIRRATTLNNTLVVVGLVLVMFNAYLYLNSEPIISESQADSSTHRVHVLMQRGVNGWRSIGEVIRVHRPFYLNSKQGRTPKYVLRCQDFTRRHSVNSQECLVTLRRPDYEKSGADFDPVLKMLNSHPPASCSNSSAVIVPISWRDSNVCHTLMKILFAFTASQRSRLSPQWLNNMPPVRTVIILAPSSSAFSVFHPQANTFQAGFLRALFIKNGIQVHTFRSVQDIANKRMCFAAAAVTLSYANRFSFPDSILGARAGYNAADVIANMTSRKHPLSSDALVLRHTVFQPKPPPKMIRKLLYVARGPGGRRKWSGNSEVQFRELLSDISANNSLQFSVFASSSRMTFVDQIRYFADATVIIGFHGAGLALTAFAPPGATLIEIEPDYHRLYLFGNLQSSNIRYQSVLLEPGSMDKSAAPKSASHLIDMDAKKIRQSIEELVSSQSSL